MKILVAVVENGMWCCFHVIPRLPSTLPLNSPHSSGILLQATNASGVRSGLGMRLGVAWE